MHLALLAILEGDAGVKKLKFIITGPRKKIKNAY